MLRGEAGAATTIREIVIRGITIREVTIHEVTIHGITIREVTIHGSITRKVITIIQTSTMIMEDKMAVNVFGINTGTN